MVTLQSAAHTFSGFCQVVAPPAQWLYRQVTHCTSLAKEHPLASIGIIALALLAAAHLTRHKEQAAPTRPKSDPLPVVIQERKDSPQVREQERQKARDEARVQESLRIARGNIGLFLDWTNTFFDNLEGEGDALRRQHQTLMTKHAELANQLGKLDPSKLLKEQRELLEAAHERLQAWTQEPSAQHE